MNKILVNLEEKTPVSRIPSLILEKGWDASAWRARCLLVGLSGDTADRLLSGDAGVSVKTLTKAAAALGAEWDELIGLE